MILLCISVRTPAQQKSDTFHMGDQPVVLSEIVISRRLDVASFIERVKNDTTFYKAFRNLHILGYTAHNDIRMLDKKGNPEASLRSLTIQTRQGGCRKMKVVRQEVTGDMLNASGEFNYYTAQVYAGLFFTKDSVCGEDNLVKGREFSTEGLSGMEKHKEQLKTLFFNPGKKISGLPFISNKTAIFDASMADKYDMSIDYEEQDSIPCYVFSVKVKKGMEDKVVIDEMTTWFTEKTFEIMARNYTLSYDAGLYDFHVDMKVRMTRVGELIVPDLITYNGNWKALFKKRERGIFTATLSGFTEGN